MAKKVTGPKGKHPTDILLIGHVDLLLPKGILSKD